MAREPGRIAARFPSRPHPVSRDKTMMHSEIELDAFDPKRWGARGWR